MGIEPFLDLLGTDGCVLEGGLAVEDGGDGFGVQEVVLVGPPAEKADPSVTQPDEVIALLLGAQLAVENEGDGGREERFALGELLDDDEREADLLGLPLDPLLWGSHPECDPPCPPLHFWGQKGRQLG
jgi:hypothetical protein